VCSVAELFLFLQIFFDLFAVDMTVSGYRATLLKKLSLFADDCVPVDVVEIAPNSNREPAGRPSGR
jgi:hypothetical protein